MTHDRLEQYSDSNHEVTQMLTNPDGQPLVITDLHEVALGAIVEQLADLFDSDLRARADIVKLAFQIPDIISLDRQGLEQSVATLKIIDYPSPTVIREQAAIYALRVNKLQRLLSGEAKLPGEREYNLEAMAYAREMRKAWQEAPWLQEAVQNLRNALDHANHWGNLKTVVEWLQMGAMGGYLSQFPFCAELNCEEAAHGCNLVDTFCYNRIRHVWDVEVSPAIHAFDGMQPEEIVEHIVIDGRQLREYAVERSESWLMLHTVGQMIEEDFEAGERIQVVDPKVLAAPVTKVRMRLPAGYEEKPSGIIAPR